MARRLALRATAALVVAPLLAGCSHYRAANEPLAHFDPNYGYRPSRVFAERPIGRVLLLLAFSGGGTRAAALSYGVLKELRDTPIVIDGQRRRLLDEVDGITSVSGGSFTSAYYGLHGDGIFDDFEKRFLRINVQGRLIASLLNPLHWPALLVTFLDRTELAIRYYDQQIFDNATFADLQAAKGPMLQMNATDLAAGHHFTFFQPQFDLLCSDLSKLHVARAAAASSAVPVAFSAIVLENYAGTCGMEPPAYLEEALTQRRTNPRRFRTAKIVEGYLDAKKRPYIDLLDGGISDNIGLRVPLENVQLVGGPMARVEQLGGITFDRIIVIVVNAEVHPPPTFDLAATAPGLAAVLGSVTDTQIYGYNFETIELMRETLKKWAQELTAATGKPVRESLITLGFEDVEDEKERAFFESVPTSFSLPNETVDRLIALSGRLLRESPDFRSIISDLEPAPGNELTTPHDGP
jgi:NTE family protein